MAIAPLVRPTEGDVRAPFDGQLGELVELWRRVDALGSLPDPATLSGDRALEAARVIAGVRHAADVLLAPFAARLDELSEPSHPTRYARWKGFPSAAALISHATGLSVAEAGKLIGLGQALNRDESREAAGALLSAIPDLPLAVGGEPEHLAFSAPAPHVSPPPVPVVVPNSTPEPPPMPASVPAPPVASPLAVAIRAGWLGTEKATVIRRNVGDMTTNVAKAEAFLVERAKNLSITALRRLCLETFAELDPKGYADREHRQMRDRFVKFYDQADGTVTLAGSLPPVLAAPVKAWFEAELQTALNTQRDGDPLSQRKVGQIMADTLVSMAMHVTGCESATNRPQSTFVIRASRSVLKSGHGFATCDGIEAPITIGRALGAAADVQFAALLLGKDGVPLALSRTKRLASGAQRLVVAERDKGCAKCSVARSRANFHHIVYWDDDGPTDERNLVMLCVSCHHMVHEEGWGITLENNEVWFIPPTTVDPRRRRQPGSSVRSAA